MQAILRREPPDLPANVPAGIRQIVQHCLEKDPAQRFHSARDVGFALAAVSQGRSDSAEIAPLPSRPRAHRYVVDGAVHASTDRVRVRARPIQDARASGPAVVRSAARRTRHGAQSSAVTRWTPARLSGPGRWSNTGSGDDAGIGELERTHPPARPRHGNASLLVAGWHLDLLQPPDRRAAGGIQRACAGR